MNSNLFTIFFFSELAGKEKKDHNTTKLKEITRPNSCENSYFKTTITRAPVSLFTTVEKKGS